MINGTDGALSGAWTWVWRLQISRLVEHNSHDTTVTPVNITGSNEHLIEYAVMSNTPVYLNFACQSIIGARTDCLTKSRLFCVL